MKTFSIINIIAILCYLLFFTVVKTKAQSSPSIRECLMTQTPAECCPDPEGDSFGDDDDGGGGDDDGGSGDGDDDKGDQRGGSGGDGSGGPCNTPVSATISSNSPSCLGNDGSATINVDDLPPPVSIKWSNGVTANTISGLNGGVYSVAVTDGYGCQSTLLVALDDASNTSIDLQLLTFNESCPGTNDGAIDVIDEGNIISYLWSDGSTDANRTNLSPGTYSLTVTNINNCTADATVLIGNNECCFPVIYEDFNACISPPIGWNCPGWNPDTPDPNGGCFSVSNFAPSINKMQLPNIDLSGFDEVIVQFDYQFNPTNESTLKFVAFTEASPFPIEYFVEQNPCNNCNAMFPIPNVQDIDLSAQLVIVHENFGGQAIVDNVEIQGCVAAAPLNTSLPPNYEVCAGESVVLGGNPTATGGNTPYTYDWDFGDNSPNPVIPPQAAGTYIYQLTVTDAIGNTSSVSTNVTWSAAPEVLFTGDDSPVFRLSDGAITYCETDLASVLEAEPSGGFFSGAGVSGNVFDPAMAGIGTHTLLYTATNAGGCSATASQIVCVYPSLSPSWNSTTLNECDNPFNLNTLLTGDFGGTWSGIGVDELGVFTPSTAGVGSFNISYSVGEGNCMNTQSQNIIVDTPLSAAFTPSSSVGICEGIINLNNWLNPLSTTNGAWYASTGVSESNFNPESAGLGSINISYSVGMGNCFDSQTATINIVDCGVRVNLNMLLEGAVITANFMETTLLNKNLIPNNQPFSVSPHSYAGAETVNTFPSNTVDWVLVQAVDELGNVLDTRAGLLLSNGLVADIDGSEGIIFENLIAGQSYQFIVRHRNHLALMSSTATIVPNPFNPIDFTSIGNIVGGSSQGKDVGNGNIALLAGDIDKNGVITVADFNIYTNQVSFLNQYLASDVNLDGVVTVADFNLYQSNASAIGVTYVRY